MGCASQLETVSAPSPFPDYPYVGAINIHELCWRHPGLGEESPAQQRLLTASPKEPALTAHPGAGQAARPPGTAEAAWLISWLSSATGELSGARCVHSSSMLHLAESLQP